MRSWKRQASYFTLIHEGKENKDAAWYYPFPKEKANHIKERVAFSFVHGADVIEEKSIY